MQFNTLFNLYGFSIKKLIFIIFLSINFLHLFAVTSKIVPDDFYRKKIAYLFNPFIVDLRTTAFRENVKAYLEERFNVQMQGRDQLPSSISADVGFVIVIGSNDVNEEFTLELAQ